MTNIKNIGKELLGKSLNSFHKKTGLTQLEKNNEMQDGILNGILSQVDDAYIEKTEQSNVMHLDGSGDGVVVLDSIEGNTMVNLCPKLSEFNHSSMEKLTNTKIKINQLSSGNVQLLKKPTEMLLKPNTLYTVFAQVEENTISNDIQLVHSYTEHFASKDIVIIKGKQIGCIIGKFTTKDDLNNKNFCIQVPPNTTEQGYIILSKMIVLEGDCTNKEINYFEGLQSSFEEKVNDEGKYEVEILMNNENLFDTSNIVKDYYWFGNGNFNPHNGSFLSETFVPVKEGMQLCSNVGGGSVQYMTYDQSKNLISRTNGSNFTVPSGVSYMRFSFYNSSLPYGEGKITIGNNIGNYIPNKQNKIKLLINEPLRAIGDIKDKLCVKDGKLMIERNLSSTTLKDIDSFVDNASSNTPSILYCKFILNNKIVSHNGQEVQSIICDKYATVSYDRRFETDAEGIYDVSHNNSVYVKLLKSKVSSTTDINVLNEYFKNNPTCVVYKSATTYEEVLNEYGEPILLEGYENGTLYIDSTIVPTTTVRYTPKMESFNALKEVKDNNIMLTNDINNTIVPYMMEVDLMIMEKEVALMSQKNIRKVGEKDMTSMQKRTQQMLERLIKGRTLTEQECQTRVTTYLNANKITDEQAEELNFLIDEIYA